MKRKKNRKRLLVFSLKNYDWSLIQPMYYFVKFRDSDEYLKRKKNIKIS